MENPDKLSKRYTAVLVASGSARRMGFDKLLARLAGQSVLCRSFLRLATHAKISHLVLVTSPEREASLREELAQLDSQLPRLCSWERVAGGAERQDSVLAGLEACSDDTDFVLVHDAARPLLSEADLSACMEALQTQPAAVLAAPVVDSLLVASAAEAETLPLVEKPQSREQLWAAQTPQCFPLEGLKQALKHCQAEGIQVTDEVAAARSQEIPIAVVHAQDPNFKLTRPTDFQLAEALCG